MAHWNSSRYDNVTAEIIGRGEYAIVYKARDKVMSRHVAIKQQTKQPASVRIDSARAELNALKILRGHPNVIRMLDYWEDDVNTYTVLQYAPGGELLDFVMRYGPLCERTLQHVFRQIVSAIHFAHDPARRVIHRDLKLDNIFLLNQLGEPLSVVVGDWGFSCQYDPYSTMSRNCGSVHYASPEIVLNLAYIGPEVDIWSLGVVLWALATGEFPCDGDNTTQILRAIRKAGKPDSKFSLAKKIDRRVDLSPQLRDLIKRILQFDPNHRPTPLEILQHPFLHSTEPSPAPPLQLAPALLLPPPLPLRDNGDASASESTLDRSASFSMTARATTDNPGAKRSHSTSAFPRHTAGDVIAPTDSDPAASACDHSPRRMKPTRLRTPVHDLLLQVSDAPSSSSSSKAKKRYKPRRSKSPMPHDASLSFTSSSSSSIRLRQSSADPAERHSRRTDATAASTSVMNHLRSVSPAFRIKAKRVSSSPNNISIDVDSPQRLNTSGDRHSPPVSLTDSTGSPAIPTARSASRPPPSTVPASSPSSSNRRREKKYWRFNLSFRSRRNRSRSLQDTV